MSEAVVVWTGWGKESRPIRDELRPVEQFGDEQAQDLMPILRRLEDEFYESDARFTAAGLAQMSHRAAERFATFHPELSSTAIAALAWCYIYDFK